MALQENYGVDVVVLYVSRHKNDTKTLAPLQHLVWQKTLLVKASWKTTLLLETEDFDPIQGFHER